LRCIRSNIRELADLPTTSGDRLRLHDLRQTQVAEAVRRRRALLWAPVKTIGAS
jgi:hypothetical protein